MKYIIFGAGVTGTYAISFLGWNRVLCFVDNVHYGEKFCNKEVISFEELYKFYTEENAVVVIASEKYWKEMEQQLLATDKIKRYFIFHEKDMEKIQDVFPSYMLYGQKTYVPYLKALANYRISQYRNIAIYGTNQYLHYLISEVMVQSPAAKIRLISANGVIEENDLNCERTTLESCKEEMDCLIINARRDEDNIREVLEEMSSDFAVVDLYAQEQFEPAFRYGEMKKYKDIHKGKRCFIVGNGPSLRFEDLEKLREHGEICFAFNKMYRAYDRTKWRADYYGMTDWRAVVDLKEALSEIPGIVFVGDHTYHCGDCIFMEGVEYFHAITELFYPNLPGFSDDMVKGFYNGSTVTYDIGLQLAAYMGFKEIYLLGIDHNFSKSDVDKKNHFIDNYHTEEELERYKATCFDLEKAEKQYEKAEKYSRGQGFRIYNATRGGKLEVFERVDFDSLF